MAQMKEQIQDSRKRTNQQGDTNLSDAEFKTLVIRMLTEMTEFGHKMKEEMKAIQSEMRKIYREPTVKGRKLGLEPTIWNKRKK